MSEFRKYESVERFGKGETDGILNGTVFIQEKIDGANCSIFQDEENGLTICSRNRILYTDKGGVIDNFRGLVEYVRNNDKILTMVKTYSHCIFYAEYLIKHSITYPIQFQKKVWFYDMFNKRTGFYESSDIAEQWFKVNAVDYVPIIATLTNPTIEQCKEYMNVNEFKGNPRQEGIVIKNPDFINRYGRQCYAKVVAEEFKELNKEIFGKRSKCCHWQVEECKAETDIVMTINKCSKCGKECEIEIVEPPKKEDIETKIALKYCTQARVEKICNKIQDNRIFKLELPECRVLEKDIPQLLGMVYNDIIKEESWEIIKEFKNPTIDFKKLQREITNLTKVYFFKYLEN